MFFYFQGIGFATALEFAKRGARVILACRNMKEGEKAKYRIINETENKNILCKHLDLASFETVRQFAKDINATEERLDILVNNAGGAFLGNSYTKDGFQITMQTNYYGPFLLTHLLLGEKKGLFNKISTLINSNLFFRQVEKFGS